MDIDLEKALKKVSAVKLPGGVVGKVCLVLIVVTLCLGGLAAYSDNDWIRGGAIAAIVVVAFPMLWRLINFADRHPQAALLEGAEFLVHQQIVMATKTQPEIVLDVSAITEERPAELAPEDTRRLDEPEGTATLPAGVPEDGGDR